jgi:hypothetical protein
LPDFSPRFGKFSVNRIKKEPNQKKQEMQKEHKQTIANYLRPSKKGNQRNKSKAKLPNQFNDFQSKPIKESQ